MIFVQRSNVPRPQWFGSPDWGDAQTALLKHVHAKAPARAQTRSATVAGHFPPEVVEALWRVFAGRCSMCESNLGTPNLSRVKRFRPLEVEDAPNRHAYAYAALLWENLILLCPACDRARGDTFPLLKPGPSIPQKKLKPARPRAWRRFYDALEWHLAETRAAERPAQIDPGFDQPGEFLVFHANGTVDASKPLSVEHARRGQATIETFQLNRSELVAGRKRAARAITTALRGARLAKTGKDPAAAATAINAAHQQLGPAVELLGGEFQGAKAFTFARWLERRMEAPLASVLPLLNWPKAALDDGRRVLLPAWTAISRNIRAARGTSAGRGDTAAVGAPEPPRASGPPRFSHQRLTKVVLTNFRHFDSATFTIPSDQPADAFGAGRKIREMIAAAGMGPGTEETTSCGWKMLLGENGVGKSSVLQAIAAALTADAYGKDLLKQWLGCDLTHSLPPKRTEGSIELTLEEPHKVIRVTFTRKKVEVKTTPVNVSAAGKTENPPEIIFLRGYGATRLLPPNSARSAGARADDPQGAPPRLPDPLPQDVRNLFNPFHPLANAEAWLKQLDGEAQHQAFLTLKELLDLPTGNATDGSDGANLKFGVWHGAETFGLEYRDHFTPLEHFSAGYQSVIALGCDIMAGFGNHVGNMQKRTGIVLLDEIGTNLHPRWRLRIVGALRRAFPLLQFIASTHEPLCLRGLGQNEAALLTLEDGDDAGMTAAAKLPAARKGAAAVKGAATLKGSADAAARRARKRPYVSLRDDLPSPATYRVDQLLTGDFFGLRTAYDPDEEAAYDLYHTLLVEERQAGKLPPARATLLNQLQQLLKGRLQLGDTAAERRVLAALEEAEVEFGKKAGEPLKGSPAAETAARRLLRIIAPQP